MSRLVEKSGTAAADTSVRAGDRLAEFERLRELTLDMGRLIRLLDESGEHSEFWTQDGDYIIDSRFPK